MGWSLPQQPQIAVCALLVPSKPRGPCQTGVDHELVANFYLYQCVAVYSSERNAIKSEDLLLSTVSKSLLFKKCLGCYLQCSYQNLVMILSGNLCLSLNCAFFFFFFFHPTLIWSSWELLCMLINKMWLLVYRIRRDSSEFLAVETTAAAAGTLWGFTVKAFIFY